MTALKKSRRNFCGKIYHYEGDKLHRLNGPAVYIEWSKDESSKQWWIDGKRLPVSTTEEFKKWLSEHNLPSSKRKLPHP